MKSVSTRQAGFSLVEVLVALVVLSVGIYSVAGLVSDSRRTAAGSDHRLQAAGLAQLKLEELKSAPALAELAAPLESEELLLPPEGPGTFDQNPRYAWRATLQRDSELADRFHIRVEVSSAPAAQPSPLPPVSASGFVFLPTSTQKGGSPQ